MLIKKLAQCRCGREVEVLVDVEAEIETPSETSKRLARKCDKLTSELEKATAELAPAVARVSSLELVNEVLNRKIAEHEKRATGLSSRIASLEDELLKARAPRGLLSRIFA